MNLSLKKILYIVIGIAAAGVAKADDTSHSLSLTNVAKSNKAGKQLKASKQSKASGKASKTKTKAGKGDHSLSYSMSYGPVSDPDSIRAGLQFPVGRIGRYLRMTLSQGESGLLMGGKQTSVFLTAVIESLGAGLCALALDIATADGRMIILQSDIESGLAKDDDLAYFYSSGEWRSAETAVNLEHGIRRVLTENFPESDITTKGLASVNLLLNHALNRIFLEAIMLASAENADALNAQYIRNGVEFSFTRVGGDPSNPPSYETSNAALAYADAALEKYARK